MSINYDSMWSELDDMKKYGPSSRHTRRLIRQAARHIPFKSVVDIGCGDGTLLMYFQRWFPQIQEFYGLDISEEAVRRAAEKIPSAVFMCWDATQQAPQIHADLAVCSEVLEHVEDDVAALRSMAKIASQIIITVPSGNMTDDQKRAGHIRHYTAETLAEKCERAGLQVAHCTSWGFPFFSLYKRALAKQSRGYKVGRYTPTKKLICHALYCLFMLNLPGRGDRIIATVHSR